MELALINLIIDDGVPNRGHRRALFSMDYKHVGVSFREDSEKVVSVVAMTQHALNAIPSIPQNIATSTSHLQTLTQLGQLEIPSESKENVIDVESQDHVWTLNRVGTSTKPPSTTNAEP